MPRAPRHRAARLTPAPRTAAVLLAAAASGLALAGLGLAGCNDPTDDGSSIARGGPDEGTSLPAINANAGTTTPDLPEPPGKSSADEHPLVASFSGFRAPKPASWQWQPTTMSMRAGTWIVPGTSGETHATLVAFSGIGGSREQNIARWAGQMRTAEQRTVTPDVTEVEMQGAGFTGAIVDMTGEYRGMGAPAFDAGQRFLGAIIETPGAPVQIRMTGPEAVVTRNREAFFDLVRGLKLAGDFPLPASGG